MNEKEIRADLLRLGVLMSIIVAIFITIKIYDQKTNFLTEFGSKFYNRIISTK